MNGADWGWLKVAAAVFGFTSISLFLVWVVLNVTGEQQVAEEVKSLPDQLEWAEQEAITTTGNSFTGMIAELNEDRKEAVAREEDPYMKNAINGIYLYVMLVLISAFVGVGVALFKR